MISCIIILNVTLRYSKSYLPSLFIKDIFNAQQSIFLASALRLQSEKPGHVSIVQSSNIIAIKGFNPFLKYVPKPLNSRTLSMNYLSNTFLKSTNSTIPGMSSSSILQIRSYTIQLHSPISTL